MRCGQPVNYMSCQFLAGQPLKAPSQEETGSERQKGKLDDWRGPAGGENIIICLKLESHLLRRIHIF